MVESLLWDSEMVTYCEMLLEAMQKKVKKQWNKIFNPG